MQRITNITLIFQARVSVRARKNVVRRENIDGPYRNRKIEVPADIPIGAGTGANLEMRRIVSELIRRYRKKEDVLFYVTVEIERDDTEHYFKTIVPRSQLPV